MNELHLFAGAGGGILGGMLLGHTCVCAVEIEPYCQKVLLQRQRDGILPKFPIWDDVRTFDGKPWRGKVDVICGGFPCQDISCAGKGAGIDGERSGLWSEFARIIGEVRPRYAFVENSPMLAVRGLGRVLGDLSEIGYNARWCVMGANDVGAPHIRKRMWILAYARHKCRGNSFRQRIRGTCERELEKTEWQSETVEVARPSARTEIVSDTELFGNGRREQFEECEQKKGNTSETLSDSNEERLQGARSKFESTGITRDCEEVLSDADVSRCESECGLEKEPSERLGRSCAWWDRDPADQDGAFESQLGRVADGVVNRVDRLKAIGNGQVPLVAATAFRLLKGNGDER